jgi:hypothetical protein
MKKSKSSTPFVMRLADWSPTLAVSLIAIADGIMNCGSLLAAKPSFVYLQSLSEIYNDDTSVEPGMKIINLPRSHVDNTCR